MLVLLFLISLACAGPTNNFSKLPNELIENIVSKIGSYKDLVAFNITNKSFYPVIRPIFDLANACQVNSAEVWPDYMIQIKVNSIVDVNKCASHLMRYSYIYKRMSLIGTPIAIIALFDDITAPMSQLVDISFDTRTLDAPLLIQVFQSIKFGLINLDLTGQEVNQYVISILAVNLDRRISPKQKINGLFFYFNDQTLPVGLFKKFFQTLPHSNSLKQLSFIGSPYFDALSEFAEVLPKSSLSTLECISAFGLLDAEIQALGVALVQTSTMKNAMFLSFPSSHILLEAMIPGLAQSNLESLEIMYGTSMDEPVSLITTLPSSLKSLDFSSNGLNATTLVNFVGVVGKSNVRDLNLMRNDAYLKASEVQKIADYIVGSRLLSVDLSFNEIDASSEIILESARAHTNIKYRNKPLL